MGLQSTLATCKVEYCVFNLSIIQDCSNMKCENIGTMYSTEQECAHGLDSCNGLAQQVTNIQTSWLWINTSMHTTADREKIMDHQVEKNLTLDFSPLAPE
jgi:hypothetical protein